MTNETKNKPAATIRDGVLKVNIWANETQYGIRHNIDSVIRSYTDNNGVWKNTYSISNGDILKASRLLLKAYDRIAELEAENKTSDEKSTDDNGAQE